MGWLREGLVGESVWDSAYLLHEFILISRTEVALVVDPLVLHGLSIQFILNLTQELRYKSD